MKETGTTDEDDVLVFEIPAFKFAHSEMPATRSGILLTADVGQHRRLLTYRVRSLKNRTNAALGGGFPYVHPCGVVDSTAVKSGNTRRGLQQVPGNIVGPIARQTTSRMPGDQFVLSSSSSGESNVPR